MPIITFNSVTPDPIKTYIFIPYNSPLLDSEALYCEFWIFYFKIKRHTCIYKNIRKKVFVSPDFTGLLISQFKRANLCRVKTEPLVSTNQQAATCTSQDLPVFMKFSFVRIKM